MYTLPPPEAPVHFGDLFVAAWLAEAWLEEDAVRLGPVTLISGHEGYSPYAAEEGDTFLLSHGRIPVAALLINDDCYIETILNRDQHGRLHFAPVFALSEDGAERHKQLSSAAYTLFPLPPSGPFAGGVAALDSVFGFEVRDSLHVATLRDHRHLQLNEKMSLRLETRWGAHAARRGGLVASVTRGKLEKLLPDDPQGRSAAKKLGALLGTTWGNEGAIVDLIDTAAEQGQSLDDILDDLLAFISEIGTGADGAEEALRAYRVSNETPENSAANGG